MNYIYKCCEQPSYKVKFKYNRPPEGEIIFNIKNYKRVFKKCNNCSHYFNFHNYDLEKKYEKEYFLKTYKNLEKLEKIYKKIKKLPKNKSDNYHRVEKILKFIKKKNIKIIKIADLGSGIGIFPKKISEFYKVDCYEKGKIFINFIKKKLNLNCFDIKSYNLKAKKYNFITINKIIEHIKKPKNFLVKLTKNLKKGTTIYLEVPDVLAEINGAASEEFNIEHFHVFSPKSLSYLLKISNLRLLHMSRIKEKSGKYTIYCFAIKDLNAV